MNHVSTRDVSANHGIVLCSQTFKRRAILSGRKGSDEVALMSLCGCVTDNWSTKNTRFDSLKTKLVCHANQSYLTFSSVNVGDCCPLILRQKLNAYAMQCFPSKRP